MRLTHTPEDKAYRRGFDQGVAALAYALGIKSSDLQKTVFKQRVADFRHGDIQDAKNLWTATDAETKELQSIVPSS